MSLGPVIPFLAVAIIASVTGMVHGAGRNDHELTMQCAIAFVAVVVAVAIWFNANAWFQSDRKTKAQATASGVRRNARLASLIYAWGSAAMFAIYSLSDLTWRHAWQYGLGMALFALGILIYITIVGNRKPPTLPPLFLTILHGGAALGGLTYLIGSGKLQTVKSDWAANEVFLWGGIGIATLCFLTLATQLMHNRLPANSDQPG